MSRDVSIWSVASKVTVIGVLGAGIGMAIGAALGDINFGIGVGAVLGVVGGGTLEFIRSHPTRR